MELRILIMLAIGGFIAYKLYLNVTSTFKSLKSKEVPLTPSNITKELIKKGVTSTPRYSKSIQEYDVRHLGGQPQFFNLADHSRGRFLGFFRTENDKADPRIANNNFFRIKYLVDSTTLWFIKSSKTAQTPCVFRPGIDVILKAPGEEVGLPPDGLVMIHRSMDGTKLATGFGDRMRNKFLDEQHKANILKDMIAVMHDKERLAGLGDDNKTFTDEMEEKLKRTKRLHKAAIGSKESSDMMGNPYGSEMYGDEPSSSPNQPDTSWKME